MKSVVILAMVHVLGGDGRPDAAVIPLQVMEGRECATFKKEHDANEERFVNTVGVRPIIASYYDCVALDPSTLTRLNKAMQ